MVIGEWSRGRILGRGSSATVSLASTSPSGDLFAVKSVELSRSGVLQREQSILSALNSSSSHIVSYLGFDVTPDRGGLRYNLFVEYAPGGSLSDQIKKQGGRLDEPTIRSHTHGILTGLAYLHSNLLAHCDIKPHNILIASDGRALIADFGCARWVMDGHDRKCQIGGTPMFMSPEVARGEEQGPAADVWALGCTLIEMATGHPPWPDVSDPITAIHRIAFSSDVPEFPSCISDEARDFLSKCLRRDPKERWTADQLVKHPFVAAAKCLPNSEFDRSWEKDLDLNWNSPKSILDQGFWVSSTEEEEEHSLDNPAERIRRLIGDGVSSSPPMDNWTWDENWVTVRNDEDLNDDTKCLMLSRTEDKDQIPVDGTVDGRSVDWVGSITNIDMSSCSSSSNSEEFVSDANHMDSEDLVSNSCDYCISYSSDDDTRIVRAEGGIDKENQFSSCSRDFSCNVNWDLKSKSNAFCLCFPNASCLFLVFTWMLDGYCNTQIILSSQTRRSSPVLSLSLSL